MTDSKKTPEVIFMPGAFDHMEFESQEELDAMVAEIKSMFENPEKMLEMSTPVDLEELWESDPALAELLTERLNEIDNEPRTLQ
jgi:hypothetical protein